VLLGLAAPVEELAAGFRASRHSTTCRGFMVGRTIFHEPSKLWLQGQIDDAALIRQVRTTFEKLIGVWQASRSEEQAAERAA
jgi:5-dehydro-2-deoxygluconokinase